MTYDPKHVQDLNDVLDNPEWTAEDIAKAKRIDATDPELAANIRRELRQEIRRPMDAPPRRPVRRSSR